MLASALALRYVQIGAVSAGAGTHPSIYHGTFDKTVRPAGAYAVSGRRLGRRFSWTATLAGSGIGALRAG